MPSFVVFALFCPGVVGIIIGLGCRYVIKKKTTNRDDRILVMIITVIITIITIFIMEPFITGGLDNDIYKVTSIPEGYSIITMEEISENLSQINSITKSFRRGRSPVTPKHYTYWEAGNVNGKKKKIKIEYYKTVNPYYAEIIFNGIRDELENNIEWDEETFSYLFRTFITDEVMKNLWDVDNLALTEEGYDLIIQKGNIVMYLSGDIDFNDQQTRELIISRFFSDSLVEN
jgi:hypothetical protein